MRSNLILLAPIVCFVADASVHPAAAQTPYYPQPAWTSAPPGPQPGYGAGYPPAAPATAQEPVDWGPAWSHPHDYPGPPLRGGGGGG
jgi:hypothetical protein